MGENLTSLFAWIAIMACASSVANLRGADVPVSIVYVLTALYVAIVVRVVLSALVPRRINPRNGMYVREWWRISDGGSRGGGPDYTGGPF